MQLKKHLVNFVIQILIVLSFIVPKEKKYFLFVPTHNKKDFLSGNIKALFEYIQRNHPEIKVRFLSLYGNINIPVEINEFLLSKSFFSSYWSIIRAEHIIIDMEIKHKLICYGNFSVVQLWHGTGFKNIGLLSNNYPTTSPTYKNLVRRLFNSYKLVVATSVEDAKRKNASFGTDKAVITGSPRNDVFYQENIVEHFKNKHNASEYDKVIAYTPTFRDHMTFSPFSESFWKELSEILYEQNAIFFIKKHPWDKYLTVPNNYSNIRDISAEISDVQELLTFTDMLISDYSGIISDYVITNRPILIYAYDMELYLKNCRSMYYNIDEILPRPFIFEEKDLIEKIKNSDWTKSSEYVESYNQFKKIFNQYLDGNSSQRVMNEIQKL
jgi:CDP-glycerol glycerophosphotransferase (TagB/SpsB family)